MSAPDESSLQQPQQIAVRGSIFEQLPSGYNDLSNTSSYDHDLFDPDALGIYNHEKTFPLPPKRQSYFTRHARHTFLNVYRRLFTIVFLLNIAGLSYVLATTHNWKNQPPLSLFATLAAANLTTAILIRQDYVTNLLYKMLWFVPLSAPLFFRSRIAKIYEFGGIHSGSAVGALCWFLPLTVCLTIQFVRGIIQDVAMITISYILLSLLLSIVVTAYPTFRSKAHNVFEAIHRWAGWLALALFWAEVLIFSRMESKEKKQPLGEVLIREPSFWLLAFSTVNTILPWLRLHRLQVHPEKYSDHVVRLHFSEPVPLFTGMRISEHPLGEWHSFACVPNRDGGKSGGSLLVSNAGDWTRKTILNPRKYYWVKGVPVKGVGCVARVFRSVVIVTTGSGIGPCLGIMQDIPNTKVRVIWSTRDPWNTYGKEICDLVLQVDPTAEIIDTRFVRRPDLVSKAYQVYRESEAEAVLIISNPQLTKKVVYAMESRGIPGFGPIWDS